MEGWKECKIKDVCQIIGGYAFKSKDFKSAADIPIVKIKSLKDKKIVIFDGEYVDESFLELNEKYHINYNDFIIALTGSHITLPSSAVGRVAKSNHKKTLLLNQRVGKFDVDVKLCSHDFLYHFLTTDYFFQNIGLRAKGAANQANVSAGEVGSIEIHLPPLPTQRKIAAILSAYDDLIENNLKRIKLLEEMAQITYEEWFVRMKFPGHENIVVDEETGLPEGWRKVKLSSIAEFLNGYAFAPHHWFDEGIPIIKIREMKNGISKDTPRNSGRKIPKKYWIKNGDILFSWSATLEVIQWNEGEGLLNQHLFKVIPNEKYPKSLVYLHTKNSLPIFDNLTTGATMKHIKRKELDFVKVPIPNIKNIKIFDEAIGFVLENILNLHTQNQRLNEARDILLPRLMTGMIDVDKLELEL